MGTVNAPYGDGGYQTKPAYMKRIEAVILRSALGDFYRCARQLGILGFDLSEERTDGQRLSMTDEPGSDRISRLKVDFAVLDEETKPTFHAVLESVHPDSLSIFKFDQAARPAKATKRASIHT